MATFEQIGLVFQVLQNIHGLLRDMHDNANGYLTATITPQQVAQIMVADAQQYLLRIQMLVNLAARNLALLTSALTAIGLTIAEANSLKTTLQGVANHTIAASLATSAQISTEANYILANVPVVERLW